MIPLLLIAAGGYLIVNSRERFASGGKVRLKAELDSVFAELKAFTKPKIRREYKKIAKGRELFIKETLRKETDGLYYPIDVQFKIKDGQKEIATAIVSRMTVSEAMDFWKGKRINQENKRKLSYANRKHLNLDDYAWEIDVVQVRGEYRGQGLATKLFQEIKMWAKNNDVHNLFLYRMPFEPGFGRTIYEEGLSDRSLKKFYNNQGFIEIGGSVMATQLAQGGKLPTRLEDISEIRINFPDADFWLQRKGSEKTIGKPKRDFYSENIGIKIKSEYTDLVNPEFLYYSLEYLYTQGFFEQMAVGSLALKNLRQSDIKAIPLRFGIKK